MGGAAQGSRCTPAFPTSLGGTCPHRPEGTRLGPTAVAHLSSTGVTSPGRRQRGRPCAPGGLRTPPNTAALPLPPHPHAACGEAKDKIPRPLGAGARLPGAARRTKGVPQSHCPRRASPAVADGGRSPLRVAKQVPRRRNPRAGLGGRGFAEHSRARANGRAFSLGPAGARPWAARVLGCLQKPLFSAGRRWRGRSYVSSQSQPGMSTR